MFYSNIYLLQLLTERFALITNLLKKTCKNIISALLQESLPYIGLLQALEIPL